MAEVRMRKSWEVLRNDAKRDLRILLLGCAGSGKTSILRSIARFAIESVIEPRQGFRIESMDSIGVVINAVENSDTYGTKNWETVWRNCFDNNDALIYVIDSSDRIRFGESEQILDLLLQEEQLFGLPLLIFATKQDLMNSAKVEELILEFHLDSIRDRPWHIQPCSAETKVGLEEGVNWLCENIKKT